MPFDINLLPWLVPLLYLAGALAAASALPWRAGAISTTAALTAAVAAAGWAALGTGPADGLGLTVLVLISLLGWVIARYSARYLAGQSGQGRYAAALLLTLAAVATVVLTDNLAVLLAAWALSSLALHRLLTFHRHRPAARLVAHKKFLASRLAELSLAAAIGLAYLETGSLSMTAIGAAAAGADGLPWTLHATALLVAVAVGLKSAQLPMHGWLIKVMEAPTPVSALLHAGVVNLGGFVLIRLAGLLSAAPAAQTLLVVLGATTAVVAGLAMMGSATVKERLAWSTCAQMGFMLLECGLGLYELALLHLIAHALYKAHAFLSAGDTVAAARLAELLPRQAGGGRATLAARLAAAPAALVLLLAGGAAWSALLAPAEVSAVAWLILALGLAPLLWRRPARLWRGALTVLALGQLYLLWHALFATLAAPAATTTTGLMAWAGVSLLALYLVQTWVQTRPDGAMARALRPWAAAGYHLDEHFSAAAFRMWPPAPAAGTRPGVAGQRLGGENP